MKDINIKYNVAVPVFFCYICVMSSQPNKSKKIYRAIIEISFVVFLFYSNLLMGEYNNTGLGKKNGIWWAINDIFTIENFFIAMLMAIISYVIFEFLRNKL